MPGRGGGGRGGRVERGGRGCRGTDWSGVGCSGDIMNICLGY